MKMSKVWHPCSQMKDYETLPPVRIKSARGSYFIDENGNQILDAISSWWCKSLGHQHPRLIKALQNQATAYEHVILANSTNDGIERLSDRLCDLYGHMDYAFYGGDGSTAVEIAVKMSLHAHRNSGNMKKTQFLALENGYHGETILTLALSDLGIYKKDYVDLMPKIDFIRDIPYINFVESKSHINDKWKNIERILNTQKDTLAGIVFEPVVQGAGGMLIYDPELLVRLSKWSKENNVHLIADEIMTGFYRTGKAFACHHSGITPDFACISKGLTAGWLAMSCVLTSSRIYDMFYSDYSEGKSFLHSNTYAGNALAVAVANEALSVYEEENIEQNVANIGKQMRDGMNMIQKKYPLFTNIRQIGAISAMDISFEGMDKKRRYGFELFKVALKNNLWLRPLGNTIYWMPPLNSSSDVISELISRTEKSIKEFF